MSRIRVYFGAFGEWPDPQEVTDVVGREPSVFKPVGSPLAPEGASRRKRVWRIDSGLPESADVEEQLAALLDVLEPYKPGVRRARERYDAGILCAAYWSTFTPGIHLSEELIRRTAELGLSIDFDMYYLGEE